MNHIRFGFVLIAGWLVSCAVLGCTHKIVGERERPIVIEAHVTIDIRGLKETATGIEDMVSKPAVSESKKGS